MIDVTSYLREMHHHISDAHYAGYDPYDALNSPLLNLLGRRSKFVRIAFTQFLKRSPLNLRPLLRIKKGYNPKALGLFLWGYVKLYALDGRPDRLEAVDTLLDLLVRTMSLGYSGSCWGYNFDWQSGTYLRPANTPTVVNTAFIGHALLDCYRLTGRQRALDLAVSIKDFILEDLNRTQDGDLFCFSYTPVDAGVVHNANLLGASILARLDQYCDGDARMGEAVQASVGYTMKRQREDGAWYYGSIDKQHWVDSFHTGFNLQALRYIMQEGFAGEYKRAYCSGLRYYAESFFLADGTPKYYDRRIYPIDIHAPTQAVYFFSGEGGAYRQLTDRVLKWMLENMYSARGYFYFRKHRFFTNRIDYTRWSQAWAFHALTEYQFRRQIRSEAEHAAGRDVPCTRNTGDRAGIV